MTSQINITAIDELYPIAGQENDTQGFRDNFGAIRTALAVTKTEIETLQTKSILSSSLTSTTPILNNLSGSTLSNGLYNQLNGVVRNAGIINTFTDIDLNNGPLQVFALSADVTFTFRNWPLDGQYGKIRLHLRSTGSSHNVVFVTANAGTVITATGFPAPLILPATQKHIVLEAWTFTSGATVYVRYIGEF